MASSPSSCKTRLRVCRCCIWASGSSSSLSPTPSSSTSTITLRYIAMGGMRAPFTGVVHPSLELIDKDHP
ncbi:hypothetical protein OPV22_017998 [Ensete ventricosum]|uniref:Uncharacterized protein n=1 Tax=Ensete ventricosum TaxID=4639 RepID=A0AAV8QXN5_ENSVE|nr:hypothetical protein OPV22_017998 [Ensete ventricosum]